MSMLIVTSPELTKQPLSLVLITSARISREVFSVPVQMDIEMNWTPFYMYKVNIDVCPSRPSRGISKVTTIDQLMTLKFWWARNSQHGLNHFMRCYIRVVYTIQY